MYLEVTKVHNGTYQLYYLHALVIHVRYRTHLTLVVCDNVCCICADPWKVWEWILAHRCLGEQNFVRISIGYDVWRVIAGEHNYAMIYCVFFLLFSWCYSICLINFHSNRCCVIIIDWSILIFLNIISSDWHIFYFHWHYDTRFVNQLASSRFLVF